MKVARAIIVTPSPVIVRGASKQTIMRTIIDGAHGVYLVQRSRYDDRPGLWEFPGGEVEPGEDPRRTAEREVQEELGGLRIRAGHLIYTLARGHITFFYLATIEKASMPNTGPEAAKIIQLLPNDVLAWHNITESTERVVIELHRLSRAAQTPRLAEPSAILTSAR